MLPPGVDPWPAQNQYTAHGHSARKADDFALARELRRILPDETYPGVLASCLGVNAIFLRSPSKAAYKTEVPSAVRRQVERFCVERVRRLVTIVQPRHVVTIGLLTLELFKDTPTESEPTVEKTKATETGRGARWIRSAGTIATREAYAVLHLTGPTGMDAAEREAITHFLRSLVGPPTPVAG
ncbi:hypothetical protein D9599_19375 [Roseomonas sp. KE2513]|uniref:hypothetical protein n=1 Tax=Roseomonas sp. KE2513 TaxID=2479202 RepID=UPI0018DF9714|nr:hypothetical protein [Roseomonas sp. KE2513]MBI0537726.1 hypothetical protein [Roseomonas sp. KE2513]